MKLFFFTLAYGSMNANKNTDTNTGNTFSMTHLNKLDRAMLMLMLWLRIKSYVHNMILGGDMHLLYNESACPKYGMVD